MACTSLAGKCILAYILPPTGATRDVATLPVVNECIMKGLAFLSPRPFLA